MATGSYFSRNPGVIEIVGADFDRDGGAGGEIGREVVEALGQVGYDRFAIGQFGVECVAAEGGGDAGAGDEWFFWHSRWLDWSGGS